MFGVYAPWIVVIKELFQALCGESSVSHLTVTRHVSDVNGNLRMARLRIYRF